MTWFEWLGSWGESVEFGLAMVLALFGLECLVLARKSYLGTRAVLDEGSVLGAEFGVFSAPTAHLQSEPEVPRNCYLLGALGALALVVSMGLLIFAFV